jgi:hypothetical protein
MEHSPSSEADSRSAGQEIPCLLLSFNVHYCVHKNLVPSPIQTNTLHKFVPCFYMTYFNIILTSIHVSQIVISLQVSD